MRIAGLALGLFALHAVAAPTSYQPAQLPNSSFIADTTDLDPIPPSSCFVKLDGLLQDLTSSTLSILFGSTTTMVGYAFCGLAMPASSWEPCTDYAVIAGSVVGVSHLVIWKFPQIMDDLHLYETTTRPWDSEPAWGEDEAPDVKTDIKPRERAGRALLDRLQY